MLSFVLVVYEVSAETWRISGTITYTKDTLKYTITKNVVSSTVVPRVLNSVKVLFPADTAKVLGTTSPP